MVLLLVTGHNHLHHHQVFKILSTVKIKKDSMSSKDERNNILRSVFNSAANLTFFFIFKHAEEESVRSYFVSLIVCGGSGVLFCRPI